MSEAPRAKRRRRRCCAGCPAWRCSATTGASGCRADLLAGVSVCVVMIPSVIAYAGLMGLPPQHGLYAALVPLLVYPFFGSSRQVIVGPDIAISLLIASAIAPLAAGDPARAAVLAATVAVLSGLLLLLGARAKIGAIADFLSKPVLVGYMTGAALILVASQLDKLFGIRLEHNDFFPRLAELAGKLHQAHGPTLLFGLGLLAVIVVLRRVAPKIPPALVVVVAAIAASLALRLEGRGVAVVGAFPRGLPGFALPAADWRDIHTLLPAAIGIALLTYTEGILLARAFAAKNGYEVNPNQELTALGLADVFTGLFQGFSVTGSQARTTINDSAGGKTQLASLVAAATLILFLLFLTPLIARLPVVALAALLIYGGFTLVEFDVMVRIYRFYPAQRPVGGAHHPGRAGGRRGARHPGRRGPLAAGPDRPHLQPARRRPAHRAGRRLPRPGRRVERADHSRLHRLSFLCAAALLQRRPFRRARAPARRRQPHAGALVPGGRPGHHRH